MQIGAFANCLSRTLTALACRDRADEGTVDFAWLKSDNNQLQGQVLTGLVQDNDGVVRAASVSIKYVISYQ